MSDYFKILEHERFLKHRDRENQEKLDAIAAGRPMPRFRAGTGQARNTYVTKEDRRRVMELHRGMNWIEASQAEKRRDGIEVGGSTIAEPPEDEFNAL